MEAKEKVCMKAKWNLSLVTGLNLYIFETCMNKNLVIYRISVTFIPLWSQKICFTGCERQGVSEGGNPEV